MIYPRISIWRNNAEEWHNTEDIWFGIGGYRHLHTKGFTLNIFTYWAMIDIVLYWDKQRYIESKRRS